MRVHIYPADAYGCGYYRLIWAAQALQRAGHDITIEMPESRQTLTAILDGDRVIDVTCPATDVLVFQRVTHHHLACAIPVIRERFGVAVVVDMDDDLSRLPTWNPSFEAMHPRNLAAGRSQHAWSCAVDACNAATLVTVSTPALLRRYAPHGRGVVIENRVPAAYLQIQHEDSATVGYGGAVFSHRDDVERLGPSLARLMGDGVRVTTIGDTTGLREILGLPDDPIPVGPVDLDVWPHAISRFGVGIVPLADTQFNQAKSWLKPMELAATGVPCVTSPSPEYRRLHRAGVGLLAEDPKAWYRILRRLVRDAGERQDLAARGRAVAAEWTIEAGAHLWWQAWKHAWELQQADRPRQPAPARPVVSPFGLPAAGVPAVRAPFVPALHPSRLGKTLQGQVRLR